MSKAFSPKHVPMWQEVVETKAAGDPTRGPELVNEEEMTDAQMKRREKIVMSMKDKEADFKDRYGDRWKEVMYATATKMAMGEASLSEAPETFTVMAIGDTNPEYKRGGVSYKPNTKVIDQMHSLEKSDVMHAAKMFRQKHPKATISVENKSGKIVKVFKPGEMIKENIEVPLHEDDCTCAMCESRRMHEETEYQAYFRDMLKKHGYDSPEEIPDDKKDDFFNAVDKGYSAKNEGWSSRTKSMKEDKKPYVWKCMNCGNKWRSSQSGQVTDVRCSKCGASGEDDILPGRMDAENLKEFMGGYDAGTVSTAREGQKKNQLSLQHAGERSALKQRQEKEREQAKTGLDKDRLVAKHEREREELKKKHDRERENIQEKVMGKITEDTTEADDLNMMKAQLMSITDRANALLGMLDSKAPANVEAWVQAKVTDADTALTSLHDYFKYSDEQNSEFPVEPLAEAELLIKGEKPLTNVTLPLKKMAAMAFAGAFMDRPVGATPEAMVNQALAVYFQKNKTPNIVKLRNLGRMLQLVSKMGINWNEELIPPQLVKFVNAAASPSGLPIQESLDEAPLTPAQQLSRQHKQQMGALKQRQTREKMQQQQRTMQAKMQKQQQQIAGKPTVSKTGQTQSKLRPMRTSK